MVSPLNIPIYREAKPEDASLLASFMATSLQETAFLLHSPGEGEVSSKDWLETIILTEFLSHHKIFICFFESSIVGFCELIGGKFKRNKHSASLSLVVGKLYWGSGIAESLLKKAEEWANKRNLYRLELEVISNNNRALKFYEKHGYCYEGKREKLVYDGNNYLDLVRLTKFLEHNKYNENNNI